jgi:hypothetical protein
LTYQSNGESILGITIDMFLGINQYYFDLYKTCFNWVGAPRL